MVNVGAMSFYNLIFGSAPMEASVFLTDEVLKLEAVGRYRDIEVIKHVCEKDDWRTYHGEESLDSYEGQLLIMLTTRDGGNNGRCSESKYFTDYCDYDSEEETPCYGCTGCTQTHSIPMNPHYITHRDASWDCTYAETFFRIPPEHLEACQKLYDQRQR